MSKTKAPLAGLDPLKDLLGDVISRIEALESKVGGSPPTSASEKVTPSQSHAGTCHSR